METEQTEVKKYRASLMLTFELDAPNEHTAFDYIKGLIEDGEIGDMSYSADKAIETLSVYELPPSDEAKEEAAQEAA